jgi:hypothetical protein
MTMTMTRRHLLAGIAALALLPREAFAAAVEETGTLLELLPDPDAAARLGKTWIDQEHPQAGALLQGLRHRLGGGDAGKLRDAIAADFRGGAVVKVEGWQIARTQAELCALAYFAKTGSL